MFEKVVEVKGRKFLLKVEDSAVHEDYGKYDELRQEIWGWAEDALASTRNLMCGNFLYDGSSLFIGAFVETEGGGFARKDREHMVGFSYGFVGVKDKRVGFRSLDNLQFYSQYTAVKRGFESFGLGRRIKEFQRQALIDLLGIYAVTCTYDPLTAVNAYRNIHQLGMEVVRYDVDIYGQFGGYLNRVDVPSDRFTMAWDLRKPAESPDFDLVSLAKSQRVVNRVEHGLVQGKSGPVELQFIREVSFGLDQDVLLVEIPFDFFRMLTETDVDDRQTRDIPRAWRLATREIFRSLLGRGYRIVDFGPAVIGGRRRDFYVLRKPAAAAGE